jgi:hypothetical protein
VLDLQAMRTHQALQIRYIIRQGVSVEHALISRCREIGAHR